MRFTPRSPCSSSSKHTSRSSSDLPPVTTLHSTSPSTSWHFVVALCCGTLHNLSLSHHFHCPEATTSKKSKFLQVLERCSLKVFPKVQFLSPQNPMESRPLGSSPGSPLGSLNLMFPKRFESPAFGATVAFFTAAVPSLPRFIRSCDLRKLGKKNELKVENRQLSNNESWKVLEYWKVIFVDRCLDSQRYHSV